MSKENKPQLENTLGEAIVWIGGFLLLGAFANAFLIPYVLKHLP